MKSRKITRGLYRRRIITFGSVIFGAIALIVTGLATWMMSTGIKHNSQGNVNIDIFTDSNLEFKELEIYKVVEVYDEATDTWSEVEVKVGDLDKLSGFSFVFEPKASDTTGRIHYGESESGPESLKMIIRGVISPKEILSRVEFKLNLPAGIVKAVNKGYIETPTCATSIVSLKEGAGLTVVENTTNDLKFEYVIEFKWGATFGGKNPGIYFDELSDEEYDSNEAKAELEEFRALVYGYQFGVDDPNNYNTSVDAPQFNLTITAKIK